MNKADIIEGIRTKSNLSRRQATVVVDTLFDTMMETLGQGDYVLLSHFGTFFPKERAARDGRDPRTKERIHVPASKTVAFRPSRSLRSEVDR